ncbi:MAG TPA: Clp protease N-terminal domain-containing protein [Solirubrobacteraceae bacterium]|nr:Clp protease N-terminal domain-containing protein [Solirubrobacteraceae bacterium]
MFERFAGDARRVALEANSVAAGLGSPSVEAEHLLVSIAASPNPAGHGLRDVGLDPAELRDAIQRDFERVLGRVGIDASGLDISANCRRTKPRWGASAKQGLERAVKEAMLRGDRRIGCEHILLGLLRAEYGTVPRLLAAEGIDRDELTGRL